MAPLMNENPDFSTGIEAICSLDDCPLDGPTAILLADYLLGGDGGDPDALRAGVLGDNTYDQCIARYETLEELCEVLDAYFLQDLSVQRIRELRVIIAQHMWKLMNISYLHSLTKEDKKCLRYLAQRIGPFLEGTPPVEHDGIIKTFRFLEKYLALKDDASREDIFKACAVAALKAAYHSDELTLSLQLAIRTLAFFETLIEGTFIVVAEKKAAHYYIREVVTLALLEAPQLPVLADESFDAAAPENDDIQRAIQGFEARLRSPTTIDIIKWSIGRMLKKLLS